MALLLEKFRIQPVLKDSIAKRFYRQRRLGSLVKLIRA